ncbi:MAG TPA: HAD family hydrolase [Limnochordia bacterium]
MKRAVLWDVGGTLVRRAVSDEEALRMALAAIGMDARALRSDAVARAGRTLAREQERWRTPAEEAQGFRRIARILLEGTGAPQATGDRLGDLLARYEGLYAPIPGVGEIVASLAAAGYRQAVVSNWPPSLSRFLVHHGFACYFSIIVGSGDVGCLKPDPRLFRRALAELAVAPEQAVFVGDDPARDMVPARALGMAGIHFDPCGQHPAADARDAAGLRRRLTALLGGDVAPSPGVVREVQRRR